MIGGAGFRRDMVQVATVQLVGRHQGRVIALSRSVEAAIGRAAPGDAIVLVGVAVTVGTLVSLYGAIEAS